MSRLRNQAKPTRPPRAGAAKLRRPKGGGVAAGSLTGVAYEELKRRIITMAYAPGAYINEAQLCSDLGLGRTPVHLAINRLALEGMIQVIPRKGSVVAPLSLEEVMAVFEVRLLLEPGAARLAAQRATPADLEAMRVLVSGSDTADASDIERMMSIDRQFHVLMAQAARNRVLEQMLIRLHERSLRFWFVSLSDRRRQAEISKEHQQIIDRLEARDADGAEQVMRHHIETSRSRIRDSV